MSKFGTGECYCVSVLTIGFSTGLAKFATVTPEIIYLGLSSYFAGAGLMICAGIADVKQMLKEKAELKENIEHLNRLNVSEDPQPPAGPRVI